MKKKISYLTLMFLIGTISVFGQTKTENIKVLGKCGMCKARIETAAKSVDGVSAADWNQESQLLSVSYDETKTDTKKIQSEIAKAGHDTELYKASDKAYDNLPGCCKYDREMTHKKTSGNSMKSGSCCKKSNSHK